MSSRVFWVWVSGFRDSPRKATSYRAAHPGHDLGGGVNALVDAPRYERSAQRRYRRNGYYTRNLGTTVGEAEDSPVPRTRKGLRSQLFARYQRRQAALDGAISEMFVYGVSTTRVGEVVEPLTGTKPSPSKVSWVFHTLEEESQAWRARPLQNHYLYVLADGTHFTIIYDGEGCKMPIIAVVGISPGGERGVLAFSVGERENRPAWEALLEDPKRRGVEQVDLWVKDGHQAMPSAIQLLPPTRSGACSTRPSDVATRRLLPFATRTAVC